MAEETTSLVEDLLRTSLETAEITSSMMNAMPTGNKAALLTPYLFSYGDYQLSPGLNLEVDTTCAIPEIPPMPEEPMLTEVDPVSIPPAPVFTQDPPALNLDIAAPAAFDEPPPLAPSLAPVVIPESQDIVIPDVPPMLGINLPDVPLIDLPVFSATAPARPGDIGVTFQWDEDSYSSALMDLLQQRATELITTFASGYDPAVEGARWDRAREKADLAFKEAVEKTRREFATRGVSVPTGYMHLDIEATRRKAKAEVRVASQKTAEEQADLEQTTRQLAFQTMTVLEQSLMVYASRAATRGLEAAKYAQSAAIEIYDAMVNRFAAEVQLISTNAAVYKDRIRAEIAKLEIYRGQLEGQKLIAKLNLDAVEVYKARLEAVMADVKKYEAEVTGVNVRILDTRSYISRYGEEVKAYSAQIEAKTAEYKGYTTKVKGEVAKVGVLKAEADAYSNVASAYDAGVKATSEQIKLEYKSEQQLPLKAYRARLSGYRATVMKASAELMGKAASMQNSARIWGARIDSEAAVSEAMIDMQKASGLVQTSQSGVLLAQQRAVWSNAIANARKNVAIAAAEAHREAGMASSAMSAVNLSAGYTNAASYSESESTDFNDNFAGFYSNTSVHENRYTERQSS
jgi:hypothetical protein